MNTDQIEKTVVLHAPRAQVWRALTDVKAFGEWFGVNLMTGTFMPGARLQGNITHKGYEGLPIEMTMDRVEPEWLMSWHWHPNAIDPKINYSSEPTTLVAFHLSDVPGGTRLTVVESGFDALPSSRRSAAYQGNEKGWAMQMDAIQRYLKKAA